MAVVRLICRLRRVAWRTTLIIFLLYLNDNQIRPARFLFKKWSTAVFIPCRKSSQRLQNSKRIFWRLSFTEAERKIFRWPANVSSCRNEVLQSLKDIIKAKNLHHSTDLSLITWKQFCSMSVRPSHIQSYWSFISGVLHIVRLFVEVRGQLNNGFFPSYFMICLTLFESFSTQEISWLAAKVQQLKNSLIYQHISWICLDPGLSCRTFLSQTITRLLPWKW